MSNKMAKTQGINTLIIVEHFGLVSLKISFEISNLDFGINVVALGQNANL